jgi:NAD dependent epimerase/dehydratase family enzyme
VLKGYYRPDLVKEYTETSEGGDYDFLSRLSRDWEQASEPIETKSNVRRVILRSGIFTLSDKILI